MSKDVVLFVNSINSPTYQILHNYNRKTGQDLKPVVIVDERIQQSIFTLNQQDHIHGNATLLTADFSTPESIRQALLPYEGRIFSMTTQYENSIPELRKLIPFLPHIPAPTETSLDWATDKKLMRQAFNAYNPTLSPQSFHVTDTSEPTIEMIERGTQYPLIIKPSGLERSLLVSVVHNRKELIATLHRTFSYLEQAYQQWMKRLEPTVLVEEFMEGEMYSIDTYISAQGVYRHAPTVRVVTGHAIGFGDFFSHLQLSPSGLTSAETRQAQYIAEQACRALGLRAVTAHTELMKTPHGWKIIEVGPRIGGYRHNLYSMSHGVNHILNDILNRGGRVPVIPKKIKHYTAIFKTYAREEGPLGAIQGLEIAKKLPSLTAMNIPFRKGDALKFARNNGDAPIEITLCHPSADQLQSDIETLKECIQVEVCDPVVSPRAATTSPA